MWKIKVLIQFVLAHVPLGERLNFGLQILNKSHSPETVAERIPKLVETLVYLSQFVRLEGAVAVEIGTGWSPVNTLLLYVLGARTIYTFDHQVHLRLKLVQGAIQQIQSYLDQISCMTGIPTTVLTERLSRLNDAADRNHMFGRANVVYMAPADAAKSGIPDHSVDLVYSYAVLEHVPKRVIDELTSECKRILKPEGIAFHIIGLHDHYFNFDKHVSKVNFLQYPESLWRFFVKNKISYHNRLRQKDFLSIFCAHGAKIQDVRSETDPDDLKRLDHMRIDKRFSGMTKEELAVSRCEVVFSFD